MSDEKYDAKDCFSLSIQLHFLLLKRQCVTVLAFYYQNSSIALKLGVMMDLDLNLQRLIKAVTKSAFYHQKNTRIKGLLSKSDVEKRMLLF